MATNYIEPRAIMISRYEETERLYTLEHRRNELIKKCAKEWMKVQECPADEFWERAIPQALFDILDSFGGGEVAAAAYLEHWKKRRG